MQEFDLIKKYFLRLSKLNKSSLNLNDDVFFDKKKGLVISIDTYNENSHFNGHFCPFCVNFQPQNSGSAFFGSASFSTS